MSNVIQIPAYRIKDLTNFSPLGEWFLISEDGQDLLGRFWNGNMVRSAVRVENTEPTIVLDIAA